MPKEPIFVKSTKSSTWPYLLPQKRPARGFSMAFSVKSRIPTNGIYARFMPGSCWISRMLDLKNGKISLKSTIFLVFNGKIIYTAKRLWWPQYIWSHYEVGTSRDVGTDHVLKVITVALSNTQEPTTGGINGHQGGKDIYHHHGIRILVMRCYEDSQWP